MNSTSVPQPKQYPAKKFTLPLKFPYSKVEVAIWLVLFFGAFTGHLKRYLPFSDTLVTIVYDLSCFGLLGAVLLKRLSRSRRLPYSKSTPAIVVFTSFALVTAFNPLLASITQGLLGWRFLASGILLHFLGFYAFEQVNQIWRFLRVFWITAFLISLYGLVQLIRGYTAIELVWIQQLSATMMIAGTGRYRLMSTLGSAVDLGFYLTLAISTLSTVILFKCPSQRRLFALVPMVVALLFTFVRAAWFATSVAVFIAAVRLFWHKKILRLLFPVILLLVVTSILWFPRLILAISPYLENPALNERIASLATPLQDASILDRVRTWTGIWTVVKDNPYGVGVGMSGAASLRYNATIPTIITTDNTYLKVVLETGWVGLFLFFWLLSTIFLHGITLSMILYGDLKRLAIVFTTSFVAFIVLLFFGEYIELNPSRNILWIFSGILFSLPRFNSLSANNYDRITH
ncbi:MAG: O-antigen ligase family protein [Anaerolineaceae bacterium]|nr:O-antigen ligase family protein [Anaerolineaceae bacterium]